MRKTKYEILAPAGSIESMKAAIAAGADAVYMGGSRFGARAYAENPEEDMLLSAIDYAHLRSVKLFMTVNTLLKERELKKDLIPFLAPYVAAGVDAFIVQDLGVWNAIREAFPEVPLHASTQMTITGPAGAKLAKESGATRIVTARELSIKEIAAIHNEVDVEIETFVHGAICYCYSGQCLYSSLIGGRSGNRGRCAQPCRLPYDAFLNGKKLNRGDEKSLMNLKDMCALDILPDLLEAGVYSLKIEGRMKSPRYTAGVVSVYRKYVDLFEKKGRSGYKVDPADKRLLLELFDRGGQTDGYFKKQNGRDMIALHEKPEFREVDQSLLKRIDEAYILREAKEKISLILRIRKEKSVTMELIHANARVLALGEIPSEAQNRPIKAEDVRKQFSKFGQTMFEVTDMDIELDDGLFLPVKVMNDLRREGVTKLEEALLAPYRRSLPAISQLQGRSLAKEKCEPSLFVLVEEKEQAMAAVSHDLVKRIYLSLERMEMDELLQIAARIREAGKELYLALPRIFRERGQKELEKLKSYIDRMKPDGFLLRVIDEISLIKVFGPKYQYAADHSLYTFNTYARDFYKQQEFASDTAPIELNMRELLERNLSGSELIAYGRIPMMVSAQCFRCTTKGCDRTLCQIELQDRKKKRFPVKNYCRFCYNVVYNTDPLWLADEMDDLRRLNALGLRLQFSTENFRETNNIISAYENALSYIPDTFEPDSYTRGHFRRGVE